MLIFPAQIFKVPTHLYISPESDQSESHSTASCSSLWGVWIQVMGCGSRHWYRIIQDLVPDGVWGKKPNDANCVFVDDLVGCNENLLFRAEWKHFTTTSSLLQQIKHWWRSEKLPIRFCCSCSILFISFNVVLLTKHLQLTLHFKPETFLQEEGQINSVANLFYSFAIATNCQAFFIQEINVSN